MTSTKLPDDTLIKIKHSHGGGVEYLVHVDPRGRIGYKTQEAADVEIARIVKMGEDAGATVTVSKRKRLGAR